MFYESFDFQEIISVLTDEEMKIMFNTLGCDFPLKWNSKIQSNRNYFYTSEDTKYGKIIKNLIDMGCMSIIQESAWGTKSNYYGLTAKGKNIVNEVYKHDKGKPIFSLILQGCAILLAGLIVGSVISDFMSRS